MERHQYDYDVIIIGAGIGGLVCGCYLAKAGLKTLIVEKNDKPGGYCTSFTKNGFSFDACAHSIGSLRKKGSLTKILKELNIEKRLKIERYNPSNIIVAPDHKICFWNELDRTTEEFQSNFPQERDNIKRFFKYLAGIEGISFNSLRSITFEILLNRYFNDDKLKAILSFYILGICGLPPSLISASRAVTIYKEFIIDGGYYTKGGMQVLPNILSERFKELGGDLLLSRLVKKIIINNREVKGVDLAEKKYISARYVVSNVDARQTFLSLIGNEILDGRIVRKLYNMSSSLSMFILYLGINEEFDGLPRFSSNIWFLSNYNIESMYLSAINEGIDKLDWFLVRVSSDRKSILMLMNVPFKDVDYWKINKKRLVELFIKKVERVIPDLSKHIVFKDSATPITLYKRTLNYRGASYGWSGILSQSFDPDFSQITSIQNLFLTGHWTTLVQGIPGVAYLGCDTARIVLNREKSRV